MLVKESQSSEVGWTYEGVTHADESDSHFRERRRKVGGRWEKRGKERVREREREEGTSSRTFLIVRDSAGRSRVHLLLHDDAIKEEKSVFATYITKRIRCRL